MTHTQPDRALHMRASDLMTAPAIVVPDTATIREAARLMLEKNVGAVPVVDASGEAVGIVSDGDLLGQNEARRAWWLRMLAEGSGADAAFAAHGGQCTQGGFVSQRLARAGHPHHKAFAGTLSHQTAHGVQRFVRL